MNRMFERGAIFLLAAGFALLLNSCGGGVSASSDPTITLAVSPSSATAYSGVPATFAISGGGARAPYQVTSSNASLLPTPSSPISETQFVLTPSAVTAPQSVTISVQDQAGKTATSVVTIQPNFINGDITITGTAPPAFPNCVGVGIVCAGQLGTATLTVSQNGVPARGRNVRFDVVQGSFGFPVDATQLQPFATSATVTSDESGRASVVLRVNTGAAPQIATIRATDLTSGAFRTASFFIRQATVGGGDFVAIPPEWKITGTFKGICPGGVVDYLIFGGTPPYAVRSSAPLIASVSPALTAVENPSRFTATFQENKLCGTGYQVTFTVTDATGLSIQPTLTNTPGTADLPTPPPVITLSPSAVNLECGQSTQVFVAITNPGTTAPTITTAIVGSYTTSSGVPALSATVSNSTITITRAAGTVSNPIAIVVGAGSATPQIISVNSTPICSTVNTTPLIELTPASSATTPLPIALNCNGSAEVLAKISNFGTTAPKITTAINTSFFSGSAGPPVVPPALSATVTQTDNTGTIRLVRGPGNVVTTTPNPPAANGTFTVSVGAGNATVQTITVSTPLNCP